MLFRLPRDVAVRVGGLGVQVFNVGRYAYVGSAMSGLEPRVRRHLNASGAKRWHIDYLMGHSVERRALLFISDEDLECYLARVVRNLPGTTEPMRGFGSSDCACRTHLFRLGRRGYRTLADLDVPHALAAPDGSLRILCDGVVRN